MKITVGADPELFVKQGDAFVSAHLLIPGDKQDPYPVDKGAVQVDGTALEFNINPAHSADEFVDNIGSVMSTLREMVDSTYEFALTSVANFNPEYFETIPPEARELGCNPDFNAWTGEMNDMPDGSVTFRTASGHVHVGWGNQKFNVEDPGFLDQCMVAVRQLDYFLGLHTLDWDPDPTRRRLYGRAGAFRPKPYGLEYRVPSNKWLSSEELQRKVYLQVQRAFDALEAGNILQDKWGSRASDIINYNDRDWRSRYPELAREVA